MSLALRKIQLGNRSPLAIGLLVLGTIAIDVYLTGNGLSYKEIIVAFGAGIVGVIIFGGERGIQFGFVLWVLTLALGYRTVEVTPALRLHPSELLLWLLVPCILFHRKLLRNRISFPMWLWLFVPFWVLAWWPMIFGNAPWDKMFNECRNFVLLIPLMIVASVVLTRPNFWRHLLIALFLVSTWIAVMGVAEYWFPQITGMFPAFIKDAKAEPTADGFVRAQFSFWGSQTATFICALALPTTLMLVRWWRQPWQRLTLAVASTLQLLAIYIGGYRSIWLLVLLQMMIASVFGIKKHGLMLAVLCLLVAVAGYQYVPNSHERLMTGIAAFQGKPVDHSALDRKDRALEAVDQAISSPFGNGWSSAGWVHSDFLQVAANLGILAAFVFLGGYLYTLIRVGQRVLFASSRQGEHGHLGFTLFLSFIAVGWLLATQGVEVLPQLALPVWFIWALVDVWLKQTPEAERLAYEPVNLSSPAYV